MAKRYALWLAAILFVLLVTGEKIIASTIANNEAPTILNIHPDSGDMIARVPTGEWNAVNSPTRAMLLDIDMVNKNIGWAVGAAGTILKYQDGKWHQEESPSSSNLVAVEMRNSQEGWAIGNNPIAMLHYTNGSWQIYDAPILARRYYENGSYKVRPTQPNTNRYDIELFGDLQGVVVGGQLTVDLFATIFALDKSGKWEFIIDHKQPFSLLGLSLLENGAGWGVGDQVIVEFGENANIAPRPIPDHVSATLTSVSTINPNEAWAVGTDGHLAHYQSDSWELYTANENISLTDIEMLDSSEGWAVGTQGIILHYLDGIWYLYSNTQWDYLTPDIFMAIDMVSENEGWVVGAYGKILHYQISN